MTEPATISARPGRRGAHPLLRPFPLTVMAVALFLVVFSLMMARLTVGADPALRSAASAAIVASRGNATVTTRTSGAAAAGATTGASASPAANASGALPLVVTRTSGGAYGGGGDD